MIKKINKKYIIGLSALLLVAIVVISVFVFGGSNNTANNADTTDKTDDVEKGQPKHIKGDEISKTDDLPDESTFKEVTENANYILKADPTTGHFVVENKNTGDVLRSFPNPEKWDEDLAADSWKSHLKAPFMYSYVDMAERKDVLKESNPLNQKTFLKYEEIEDGFKMTYEITGQDFVIPIEVKLRDDYVETIVLADEIIDEQKVEKKKKIEELEADARKADKTKKEVISSLISLRLYPFLGAEDSTDKDGFIFLPDGSGVLVDFQDDRASTANLYSERIYGDDQAFANKSNASSRLPIKMPIFGLKSGSKAILGIVHEGDTYTNIVSAPSESFSNYNWVTGEHLFRFKVYQATNKDETEGYFTYSTDMQRTNRAIRYYMIEDEEADYVDMAIKYREYLMEYEGLTKKEVTADSVELSLNILGGGTKKGFLMDAYLPLTTIEESMQIVDELNSMGVDNMAITYHGWNKQGYGKYGGHFPVAGKLGGNSDMKDLADFTHQKGFSLFLDASSYTYNNTGKDGFRANRDALRDLSSRVMKFSKRQSDSYLVSPLFMEKTIYNDFPDAIELGVDGYLFGEGIGETLPTDYNDNYLAQRHEVKEIQKNILSKAREDFGDARISSGNFYALKDTTHIEQMDYDYSYDLFVTRTIPFSQIVLHSLVDYSFDYGNMSGNARESFLKGIEYGASPSFLVTYEESHKLLESKSMYKFYSTYYKDWETEIVKQYQDYSEALGDVQDQFIIGHRELVKGVFETTYEKGKRIVVNYTDYPYTFEDTEIEPEDYIIIEGGK